MKILVVGGGGQLGSRIIAQYKQRTLEVYSTYMSRPPALDPAHRYLLDKTEAAAIDKLVGEITPDVVIDTAALHNVDYCETHRAEAWRVNVDGTRNLALACKRFGAKIVFISTDYVFDGKKGNYNEEHTPNPLNYYGLTKLEGEKAVAESCEDHMIARSSVIYSWIPMQQSVTSTSAKPLNFAAWAVQKLSRGEPIKIVDDQYNSPTLADSLAEALIKAIDKDLRGLYHIAGKTRLSRFQFTLKLAEHMGFNKDLITPIKTSELRQLAQRPMDSSLDVGKAERDIGISLPTIDEALEIFAKQAKG
jgi:dTDP-4-dehydrorhamnose reductase